MIEIIVSYAFILVTQKLGSTEVVDAFVCPRARRSVGARRAMHAVRLTDIRRQVVRSYVGNGAQLPLRIWAGIVTVCCRWQCPLVGAQYVVFRESERS